MNSYVKRQLGPFSERQWAGGIGRKVSSFGIGHQKSDFPWVTQKDECIENQWHGVLGTDIGTPLAQEQQWWSQRGMQIYEEPDGRVLADSGLSSFLEQ